jgi:NTP pyrophosphatase (non-canonical NTP hydrolase)
MSDTFLQILEIARDNVRKNPIIVGEDTYEKTKQYLEGLTSEIEEVLVEIKDNNRIYLTDELSDIVWNTAVVLALLEERGLIESAESVLMHGLKKYTTRAPAFLEGDDTMWDAIKAKQKTELKQRHEELYGN